MKLIVVDQDGQKHEFIAAPATSLMEAIRDADLPIAAQCGGSCICATCHIYVDPEWAEKLPPKSELEEETLELASAVRPNSRLACQIETAVRFDGLRLTLAPGTSL